MEGAPQAEREPIKMSQEEMDILASASTDIDDPERIALMEAHGIDFDSGDVHIEDENGVVHRMSTARDDFGTSMPV